MTDELRDELDRIIDRLTALAVETKEADDLIYRATELLREARDL